jgi:hypothetical protein
MIVHHRYLHLAMVTKWPLEMGCRHGRGYGLKAAMCIVVEQRAHNSDLVLVKEPLEQESLSLAVRWCCPGGRWAGVLAVVPESSAADCCAAAEHRLCAQPGLGDSVSSLVMGHLHCVLYTGQKTKACLGRTKACLVSKPTLAFLWLPP